MKYRLIRKTDIIIVAFVIAAVGMFLIFTNYGDKKGLKAEISVNGEITEIIELDKITEKKTVIPGTDPAVVIAAENGTVYFESAQCKDKLCVSRGKLSKKGDTAVCLPARTVITVVGSSVDAVTY